MPRFEVEWSLQGVTSVQAGSPDEAIMKVSAMSTEALISEVDGFDVSDVEEVPE